MNRKIIKIIIFTVSILLSTSFISSANSIEQMDLRSDGPILTFNYDDQYLILYLENIGDETAYNVTITIQVKGFILFESGNDPYPNPFNMEPGERKPLIALPLVFGFGPIRMIYTASALNADPTSFTLKAFLIGPWLFLWY